MCTSVSSNYSSPPTVPSGGCKNEWQIHHPEVVSEMTLASQTEKSPMWMGSLCLRDKGIEQFSCKWSLIWNLQSPVTEHCLDAKAINHFGELMFWSLHCLSMYVINSNGGFCSTSNYWSLGNWENAMFQCHNILCASEIFLFRSCWLSENTITDGRSKIKTKKVIWLISQTRSSEITLISGWMCSKDHGLWISSHDLIFFSQSSIF